MQTINGRPFYFMRHGETDHNLYGLYDDSVDVQLNKTGENQALKLQKLCSVLGISTVCASPLIRAQQTKNILFEKNPINDVTVQQFRECPGFFWKLFLAYERRALTESEWGEINSFIQVVKNGLIRSLNEKSPILIVAHGGIYWALMHLLQVKGNKKIGNCLLRYFIPNNNGWNSEVVKIR